ADAQQFHHPQHLCSVRGVCAGRLEALPEADHQRRPAVRPAMVSRQPVWAELTLRSSFEAGRGLRHLLSSAGDSAVRLVHSHHSFGCRRPAKERLRLPRPGQEQPCATPRVRVPGVPQHGAPRSVRYLLQPVASFVCRHGALREPPVLGFADVQQLDQQSARILHVESFLGDWRIYSEPQRAGAGQDGDALHRGVQPCARAPVRQQLGSAYWVRGSAQREAEQLRRQRQLCAEHQPPAATDSHQVRIGRDGAEPQSGAAVLSDQPEHGSDLPQQYELAADRRTSPVPQRRSVWSGVPVDSRSRYREPPEPLGGDTDSTWNVWTHLASGRANRVMGVPLYPSVKSKKQWFNPAAFAAPTNAAGIPGGAYGNTGYDMLRGPRYQSWDINLEKNIEWHERYRVQLRADAFNVFNHPNFGTPNANISNTSTVGTITSVSGTPTYQQRTVEFATKFNF